MVASRNPGGTGIRQHPATEKLPDLDGSSRIWPKWQGSGGVWQFWPDPAKRVCWNPATSTERCRIPATVAFSPFCNFFVRTKRQKIFSRKLLFLKMISSKIFYDGNYFTSKQTEH